jgi:hypothetical protein
MSAEDAREMRGYSIVSNRRGRIGAGGWVVAIAFTAATAGIVLRLTFAHGVDDDSVRKGLAFAGWLLGSLAALFGLLSLGHARTLRRNAALERNAPGSIVASSFGPRLWPRP